MCWSATGGGQGAAPGNKPCSSSRRYHHHHHHYRGEERDMTDPCTVNSKSHLTTPNLAPPAAHPPAPQAAGCGSSGAPSSGGRADCRWVQHGRNMSHSATSTSASTTTSTSTSSASSSASAAAAAGCVRTSCCTSTSGGWVWNPRGLFMWPLSLQVLLLTLCYCRHVSSDDQLNLIHARLVNMLKTKQSLFYRRHLRADTSGMDLREHRVFHSDPKLDCCPTLTEFEPRRTGINPSGLVLELFSSKNFTQSFYETICHPSLRNRPCQFIDPRISYATRCVQQFSYVYAIGRTYGSNEGFRVDYIRIPAGCKCQVRSNLLRRRKKSVLPAAARQ